MTCPICDATTERAFRVRGFWIHACPRCGHRLAEIEADSEHVAAVYSDAYFSEGGAGYPDYVAQGEIIEAAGRAYARVVARHRAPGTLLDVGAAAGFVLKGFTAEGWHGTGLEPNDRIAAYGREVNGLDVRTTTLEAFEPTQRYDLVSMIQVLPHLFDLDGALRVAAAATADDGLWLIETWDRRSLTARLFGKRWHEYSPPSVLHYFDRDGVRRLAARHGFQPIDEGRRLKWLLGTHAASLATHAMSGSILERPVRALGRFLPRRVPYPSEDLFWILLRRG